MIQNGSFVCLILIVSCLFLVFLIVFDHCSIVFAQKNHTKHQKSKNVDQILNKRIRTKFKNIDNDQSIFYQMIDCFHKMTHYRFDFMVPFFYHKSLCENFASFLNHCNHQQINNDGNVVFLVYFDSIDNKKNGMFRFFSGPKLTIDNAEQKILSKMSHFYCLMLKRI